MVIAKMIVPASTRKMRSRRHALIHRICAEGQRYGGISSTKVGVGPREHGAPNHRCSRERDQTESVYIENRATAPALNQPTDCPANTVPTTRMKIGRRALHDISGSASIVTSRSRRRSIVRVAITAGTAQAKPESRGTNALPCSPTLSSDRSMTKATRAR